MNFLSRREFLRISTLCASSMVISTALSSCTTQGRTLSLKNEFSFLHGVASGDPLQQSVILWTRATPLKQQQTLQLGWQVATDKYFNHLVRSGFSEVSDDTGFTLKVDVQDLLPGTQYYYRFIGDDLTSPVGTTRTLAEGSIEQLNFIVCSCANYPAGYFNAYDDASKIEDIDAVLHLGDYLYEYGMGGYATERAVEIGRALPSGNEKELLNLADYRNRYALYRTDSALQKLHAKAPFILIWDDHEFANDTWKNGAKNHNKNEGSFEKRKLAAIQAWYEWLPVRAVEPNNKQKIYRSFDFGKLLSLHMLDTRLIARDKQLNYDDYRDDNSKKFDKKGFIKDLTSKQRKLIGDEQFTWLKSKLKKSNAKWQLLGQQILMGRMMFPSELSEYSDKYDQIPDLLNELASLKLKQLNHPENMTEKENKRLKKKNPYNLDGWDGYYHERERLLKTIKNLDKEVIVVAGDTHNAWASELTISGKKVGMEFATQSITSPGMESYLKMDATKAQKTSKSLTLLVDDLKYCNLHQRGYLHLKITLEEVTAKWIFVDNILSDSYQRSGDHSIKYKARS